MNDLRSFNGQRLKTARTIRGMSIADLAEKLEVQRQTISMYENGKISEPEYLKIYKMSEVLNFPLEFFLDNNLSHVESYPSTYFRSLLTTCKKYRYEQEVKIEFISAIYAYISEYITFPETYLPNIPDNYDIEEAALTLREHWKLGHGPIDRLIFHAEENGIIITSFSTDTNDIDAFSKKIVVNDENRYIIAFSRNKNTAARIHFDVSHELGHILLHDWDDDITNLSTQEFREREQEANDFASAFLLPQETFIKDVGSYADKLSHYIELKKKWKVSIAAMIRRSKNLGLISYDKYQSLMRKMQKLGIRKQEPLDDTLMTSQPSLLETAVNMLLNDNIVTPREFLQELSMDYNLTLYPEQVEELLNLKKDTLKQGHIKQIINLQYKKD